MCIHSIFIQTENPAECIVWCLSFMFPYSFSTTVQRLSEHIFFIPLRNERKKDEVKWLFKLGTEQFLHTKALNIEINVRS